MPCRFVVSKDETHILFYQFGEQSKIFLIALRVQHGLIDVIENLCIPAFCASIDQFASFHIFTLYANIIGSIGDGASLILSCETGRDMNFLHAQQT
jgi:hypothetical protein